MWGRVGWGVLSLDRAGGKLGCGYVCMTEEGIGGVRIISGLYPPVGVGVSAEQSVVDQASYIRVCYAASLE